MALPIIAAAAGSALGSLGGAYLGYRSASKSRKQAQANIDAAVRGLEGVPVDQLDELLGAYQTGDSEFEGLEADSGLKARQMSALDQIINEARQGGLGVQDKAALAQAQRATNQNERGQRDAILMEMARRGMGGSGQELAAQLSAQQGGAERLSAHGTAVGGMAADRRLKLLGASGEMAGRMRGQDYSERSSRAAALDQIAKFNAAGRQQAYGDQWNQRFGKAGAVANARTGGAAVQMAGAQDRMNAYAGMGGAAGTAAGYGVGSYFDGRKKEDDLSSWNGND